MTLNNKTFFAFVSLAALALAVSVLAAGGGGGGGGGSGASCTDDVWTCGAWSACSQAGHRTRVCTLTTDCPFVSTPKPPEDETCIPPVLLPPPSPTEPPPPIAVPPPPPERPQCQADVWTCSRWSECNTKGEQFRSCKRTFDCSLADTPRPAEKQLCDHLQCGNKATLGGRIFCRLQLTPEGVDRELAIQYLPEYCRALGDKSERQKCIALYKSFTPCWEKEIGDERIACARGVLKIKSSVADEAQACKGQIGRERAQCQKELNTKIHSLVLFRLYDLEERAEDLYKRGIPIEKIADFDIKIELKKQAFKNAKSSAERHTILLDARQMWKDFLSSIKNDFKSEQ